MLTAVGSTAGSVLLAGAAGEVKSCATAMVSLLQPHSGQKPDDLQAIMDTADKSGYRFLLKNAMHQCPFYEKLQSEFLEVSVAEATLMPAVMKAALEMKSLRENERAPVKEVLDALKEKVPKIALWRKKLRVGSTMELEDDMAQLIDSCVNMASHEEEVSEILEVAQLYLDVPLSAALQNAGLGPIHTRVEKSRAEAKGQITELKTQRAKKSLEDAVAAFADTPSAATLWSSLRATLQATQEEHLAEGHAVWVAQLLGKSIPHFMKVCSVAQVKCAEADLTTEDGEKARQAVGDAISTLRSLGQHLSAGRNADLQAILAIAEAFEMLTDAQQPLQEEKGNLKEFFLKDKDEGLACTALLSSYKKLVDLKEAATVDGAKFYLTPLEKPIREAGKLINGLKTVASETLAALLKADVEAVTPLAGGAANGASWKAGAVSDTAGWADIKRHATPLLEGDQTKDLFTTFSRLQKDLLFTKARA